MSTRSSSRNRPIRKRTFRIENAPRTQLPPGESFFESVDKELEFRLRFKNKKAYKTWLRSAAGTRELLQDPWKAQYQRFTKWRDD